MVCNTSEILQEILFLRWLFKYISYEVNKGINHFTTQQLNTDLRWPQFFSIFTRSFTSPSNSAAWNWPLRSLRISATQPQHIFSINLNAHLKHHQNYRFQTCQTALPTVSSLQSITMKKSTHSKPLEQTEQIILILTQVSCNIQGAAKNVPRQKLQFLKKWQIFQVQFRQNL